MKHNPPKYAEKLLAHFADRFNMPEIYGDLLELYNARSLSAPSLAKLKFWRDVVFAVPNMYFTSRRRRKPQYTANPFHMMLSNITVGLRHILKRPGYSFTTIAGLAFGIAACMVIFHYVRFERSFDQYHEKVKDIAVVYYNYKTDDLRSKSPSVPHFVGPKMQREFPEVLRQTRVLPGFGTRVIKTNNAVFEENSFANADSTFFDVFSYSLIHGKKEDQLRRPATLVLTRAAAEKYFGDENPVGKSMLFNNKREYEVTGVMENFPANSSYRCDILLSMSSSTMPEGEHWDSPNYITYLELAPGTSHQAFQDKVNNEWLSKEASFKLQIAPLAKLHFDTTIQSYVFRITDQRYLVLFVVVALLTLFIASINYVNLITARANERGREVGIRKISGATFSQLFTQFMTDSFLHILPAVFFGLMIFFAFLPIGNDFIGLALPPLTKGDYIFTTQVALAILFAVSIVAGLYPALIMTNFRPVSILKGKFQGSRSSAALRKGLVVFQFSISIALMICAAVISGQLDFMQSRNLGFDKEHTIVLPADEAITENFNSFRNEAGNLAFVKSVIPASTSPMDIVIGYGARLSEKEEDFVTVGAMRTNADFLTGMDLRITSGRNFSPDRDSAKLEFIVNETFVAKFGLQRDEVIGKPIWVGVAGVGEIVGIVNDFHTGSLHKKIEPVVLFNQNGWIGKYLIKLTPGNVQEQLAQLEPVWKKFAPHRPFAYSFLDENYNALYQSETKISRLIHLFSGLAILIACLGILGLASYNATLRAKEMSIRKVLGASGLGIVRLMAKDFIILVAIAFVLSVPLAIYFAGEWLQNFEYRISLSPIHIAIAGAIAFGFAIITIGYQTIKAAQANPADVLKSE